MNHPTFHYSDDDLAEPVATAAEIAMAVARFVFGAAVLAVFLASASMVGVAAAMLCGVQI